MLPGPVYVHCHHGKHRGPAAAAVCGLATEGWTEEQAFAGWTGGHFARLPGPLRLRPRSSSRPRPRSWSGRATLAGACEVPALVEMMVQVDERWDHLKAVQKAGFKTPADQPDIDPPHEALQLAELFRELSRLPGQGAGRRNPPAAEAAEDTRRGWRLPCGRSAKGRLPRPEGGRVGVPRGREELHGLPLPTPGSLSRNRWRPRECTLRSALGWPAPGILHRTPTWVDPVLDFASLSRTRPAMVESSGANGSGRGRSG